MRRPSKRASFTKGELIIQAVMLAAAVLVIWALAATALANLRARGMASGFEFLERPAGFQIAQSWIAYDPVDSHARVFLVGALNTLSVAAAGIVLATVIGVVAGVARRARSLVARGAASVYVEVARNTPLPIQLLVWYALITAAPPPRAALALGDAIFLTNRGLHLPSLTTAAPAWVLFFILGALGVGSALVLWALTARGATRHRRFVLKGAVVLGLAILGLAIRGVSLPHRTGFGFEGGLEVSPPLLSLLAALTFYTGGYIAEIVRGGLASVDRGQGEAAAALGLSPLQTVRLVTLPQALRVMAPPMVSQYLNLLKNSSLAVVVGYPDLVAVFGGTSLNQTGQAIETLGLVLVFFVAVSLTLSWAVNSWSRRQQRWSVR
ncbi:ABC transporter permease subunit [Caulobacter segnis]|uniref:ABC transporter permease subunit n=1 Tax=Caulobacter segnis TaxID=88688 RepID=UPI00240FA01D|nr:ABC transporter permease subunit [Caulobacter segnis]MDG2522938.1 ABC transporter permease subunit [Caulobacter segnis]